MQFFAFWCGIILVRCRCNARPELVGLLEARAEMSADRALIPFEWMREFANLPPRQFVSRAGDWEL